MNIIKFPIIRPPHDHPRNPLLHRPICSILHLLGLWHSVYLLVKVKELFAKPKGKTLPADEQLPEVTLFITAYNEEAVVDEKMLNSLALDYPAVKKKIV